MGRHSASDDDVDGPIVPAAQRAAVVATGRHSSTPAPVSETELVAESATEKLPNLVVESPFSPLLTIRTQPVPRVEPKAAALAPQAAVEPGPAVREEPAAHEGAVAARSSGTRGDLQLLRQNPWLRTRCGAAVVVPFLVFTAVLIALGRTDVFLIWFWIPTVFAGILVGAMLDRAHARQRKLASAQGD